MFMKCKVTVDTSHYPKEGIPKGWIITDLDSLCTTINGLWKGVKGPMEKNGVIRNANFTKEFTLDYSKIEYIDVESRSFEKRYLDDGDIIVEKSGGSDNFPVGRSILYNGESRKYSFSNFTMSLRLLDKRSVLPKYLYYVLQQKYRRGDMKQMQTQTTGLHNLLTDVFLSMPIPIPPKEEQKRIIERVDALFTVVSRIDALQGDLSHSVDAAKSRILELAFYGKLVPQDPSDEPAIELLKRINPSFTPSHNLHYEGILPSGWSLCCLEDVLDYEQPQAYIVNSTDYSDDYKTPVLTPGKSFVLGYTNELSGICNHLPVIIFDDFTTESKYVDFPFKVKSSAMKILRARGEINLKYVAIFMSITRLVGDTHKRYWISEYSKIPIPIPPLREQGRIVLAAKHLLNQLDNLIACISDN